MFTNRQQRTLQALCRRIAPDAGDADGFDLPAAIRRRLDAAPPFQTHRLRQALETLGNPGFIAMLTGRMRGFADLPDPLQDTVLRRCENSALPVLRLLFSGVRRLILNTWYSQPFSHAALDYRGGEPLPIAGAAPVVSDRERDRARERNVPPNVLEHPGGDQIIATEFCIIGSGVGGSVAACTLSEAGRDVVILEAGPYRTAADFTSSEYEAVRDLYADAALRATDDLRISLLQGRCAGGGSTVNWMVMLRTPDHVLEEWGRVHGVEDMSPPQMRAVFDRFERESGVGMVAEPAHSPANRILLQGARALGWRAQSANINARDCLRTGLCGLGCPYDAKHGMLKTYLARALSAGARLICNTSAEFIRGQSVIATTSDGRRVTIRAQKIIVAAGAVETAALLQRSGLGGAAVGRHLRLHPTTAVVGVYDERIDGGSGIPLSTYCDEFAQMRRGYGHWIETAPLTPGLAALALAGFGESHRTRMREYPHWAPLIVLVRDGSPDDPSRGRVTWRGGRARIDYRLSNADRSILLHGMESAARIHFAMGARSVFTLQRNAAPLSSESQLPAIHAASVNGDPLLFSAHVNGTARLGSSPKTGVCRPDGALHTHPHVYVMDGSLLPTAPGVNPHETIAAVVSMLATKLTA